MTVFIAPSSPASSPIAPRALLWPLPRVLALIVPVCGGGGSGSGWLLAAGCPPVIDALIVGMDLLIRKTAGKRYEKRIFLVTDAGCPVNQDDLDVVCEQFLKIDARLNVMYETAPLPPSGHW